jgi:hypothetical protein
LFPSALEEIGRACREQFEGLRKAPRPLAKHNFIPTAENLHVLVVKSELAGNAHRLGISTAEHFGDCHGSQYTLPIYALVQTFTGWNSGLPAEP